MEQIIISSDISCEKLGFDDASDLRKEISEKLDKALKDAEVGEWSGGACGLETMEIFIRSENPDAVIMVFKSTLANNPLLPYMKIKQGT